MKRIAIANLIVICVWGLAAAQAQGPACHVYVVDVEKARKAFATFHEAGIAETDAKAARVISRDLSAAQTSFPEFRPAMGEEELTSKTYRFPGTRLIISASVYYTDESMASAKGSDSMQVAIAISPKPQKNALSAENNAVSEVTLNDNLDTVRAKKYLRVAGRLYLVGIECRCKERTEPK